MHENDLNISLGPLYHGRWVSGMVEPNRRIYDFEFVFFATGSGRIITERQSFPCRAGTAIIVPPAVEHCTIGESACERWCIHFDWHGDCKAHGVSEKIWVFSDEQASFDASLVASSLPESMGFSFPFHKQLSQADSLVMLSRLDAFFRVGDESFSRRLSRQGLFLEILSMVFDGTVSPVQERRGNTHFFQAKALMERSYLDSSLRIGSIASRLEITPNHVNKLFRRNMGMTAMDYLHHLRLQVACQQLRGGGSVKAVAAEAGFQDSNYFARVFRAHFGMSPRDYKRHYGDGAE